MHKKVTISVTVGTDSFINPHWLAGKVEEALRGLDEVHSTRTLITDSGKIAKEE